MKHRLLPTFLLILVTASALLGQDQSDDFMRSMGKMYVVVAVLGVIFIFLIGYLVYLDIKTRKLEKQIEHGRE